MDILKKFTGGENVDGPSNTLATEAGGRNTKTDESGNGGGFMDKINGVLGGGETGEKKEDGLDKTVDWVQQNVMGEGPQNNESATEQAKDELITDSIRSQYKNMTGHEFPIADK